MDLIDLIDFEPAIADGASFLKKYRDKLDDLMKKADPEGNPIVMLVKLK